jgi:hypothetical protein
VISRIASLRQFIVLLSGLLLASYALAYDYPFDDRYVATVVGTPEEYYAKLPDSIPFKKQRIKIFPDRITPDVLFYDDQLIYSVALQKQAAPLVFLIAGTGAAHNGGKNYQMARAFYQAGMHVISLSSPTYPNFVVAASETGVPGHAEQDAEDLYRVMERVWAAQKGDIEATDFYVTGYSLGGFNAAFVTKLDEDRQVFNFRRALLINPPVSLYNSISLLDRMIENIPGGEDNFATFFETLVRGFAQAYKKQDDDLGEDFLYSAYESMDLQDEELAALIGVSFRLSSGSLIFVSDVMTNYGFLKPKEVILDRYSDLTQYRQVANRIGFTDFYHDFFFPFYREKHPDIDRDDLISSMSLRHIEDYLRNSPKVTVMHNADDVILEPGEIDFFREVFGDRAQIYPHGGHCGNMSYRDNVAFMVNTFTR